MNIGTKLILCLRNFQQDAIPDVCGRRHPGYVRMLALQV